jgi:peptide/nickel transport system substrate-binding protein
MQWLVSMLGAGLLALSVSATKPATGDNLVRWASNREVETFDPHATDELQAQWVHAYVYEPLVAYDWQWRLEPALAVSWRLVSPTSWEFDLRPGVAFHDGTPLTADDVVFSIERAMAAGSAFEDFLSGVVRVEVVDELTVRFVTAELQPSLWDSLAWVGVMSRTWTERHRADAPAEAGDLEPYTLRHANGTGPFRLESFAPRERLVLARNPTWWGRTVHPGNLDRIELIKVMPAEGLDRLLENRIDLLQHPPPDQLDRLAAVPGLRLERVESDQVLYLGFDQVSPELRSSDTKGRNPFADRRVREAIYRGIDFNAIQRALGGLAVPAGMLVAPQVNGWSDEFDRRLPYDPEAAKRLLAEAGYPGGFAARLECTDFRETMCRAVTASLDKIGIELNLRLHSLGELEELIRAKAADVYYWGITEPLDSGFVFEARYRSDAVFNLGYADPTTDAMIDAVSAATITYGRDALIEQVWRKVLNEIVYVPLYRPVNVWAVRANLDLPLDSSRGPHFQDAHMR